MPVWMRTNLVLCFNLSMCWFSFSQRWIASQEMYNWPGAQIFRWLLEDRWKNPGWNCLYWVPNMHKSFYFNFFWIYWCDLHKGGSDLHIEKLIVILLCSPHSIGTRNLNFPAMHDSCPLSISHGSLWYLFQ